MSDFKFEIAEISPVELDIKVTVPEEVIRKKIDETIDELAASSTMKGFRKGKVPKKLVARMYRKKILDEMKQDMVREGYQTAVMENDLKPVAIPNIRRPEAYKGEGDMVFSFIVEIAPKIESVNLDGVNVEWRKVAVTDEQVENEVKLKRELAATMKPVEGREIVEKNDYVRMDFEAFLNGEALDKSKRENELINLEGGQYIPGFEDRIIGNRIAEDFEFTIPFPEDYHNEELKGKDVLFKCKVNEILIKELPELDDEFAKDMGDYESLDDFRKGLRNELEEFAKKHSARIFADNLWEKIADANKIPLPPTFLNERTEDMLQTLMERAAPGVSDPAELEKLDLPKEELLEKAKDAAELEMRVIYIQEKLAEDFGVEVTEEEMEEHLEVLAKGMNITVEKLKAYYSDENRKEAMRFSLKGKKLAEILKEKVNVIEIDPKQIENDQKQDLSAGEENEEPEDSISE